MMKSPKKKESSGSTNPTLKMVVVGAISVGKTCFMIRFVNNTFVSTGPSIGIDFRVKTIVHNNQPIDLEIWDTAGHERYENIVKTFFRQSKAACIVFDVTDLQSLEKSVKWIKQLNNELEHTMPKALVGNKKDLIQTLGSPKQIQAHMAKVNQRVQEILQQYKCKYFRVSSKTGQGVDEVFEYLSAEVLKDYTREKKKVTIVPQPLIIHEPKPCCN